MNINQLEYLRELYNAGSFSAAAENLGITQPALSLQIQKLEEELDFKLIDRTKRPLKLTDEGTVFYEKTVDILQQIERLKDLSLELGEQIKGNLRVGIIPTVAPYLVPLFTQKLKTHYPELQIEVFELKTEEIIDELKMGKLDCGIISTPVSMLNIRVEPLFYERFYAYVSVKHPLAASDKLDVEEVDLNDIWYLEEGNCFQNQVNSICKINYQKKTAQQLVYRSSSIESLRRIVENECGVTFVPELATINIPAEQEEMIKELKKEEPAREISMVTVKKPARERQVIALQDVIRESIPKRMQEKPEGWIVDTML
ncbi:hydrogen peroxide-inducible genes activator [Maribellus sp. YY47]|uniref:LysR family transcriptional regulator n=1 Tax=Maribellus sp. YY47 TaxID=2929486 RepID=UPI002001D415|nr:hydrogen peroxide-inducible genes activator [Maribellus sp. YY47]MCK3685698.1 LysR substrate-binding domain-containing protein [Maribellus sp. YY47]